MQTRTITIIIAIPPSIALDILVHSHGDWTFLVLCLLKALCACLVIREVSRRNQSDNLPLPISPRWALAAHNDSR